MLILEKTRFEAESPKCVARALQRWLARIDPLEQDKEYGIVLILNVRHMVERVDVVSVGILNATLLHPREVYRRAITLSASQIIYAHNHPSGDCSPSEEDLECTRRLRDAGDVLGITLIDHIIFARNAFYSFREREGCYRKEVKLIYGIVTQKYMRAASAALCHREPDRSRSSMQVVLSLVELDAPNNGV